MPFGSFTSVSPALELRHRLIEWFRHHRRTLPWRPEKLDTPRDPYAVWVSEVMLQQTQVAVVIDRFQKWIEVFPTVSDLAGADPEAVHRLWSGLGYYARARNLIRGASVIEERYNGLFPSERAELETIPGIGPYSAGAILSLAFGKKEPIVDGNIFRIFARTEGWDVSVGDSAATKRAWAIAARWADHDTPGVINEALMELGALVCTPKKPECEGCPLREGCRSFREGKVSLRPRPRIVADTVPVDRTWVVLPVGKGKFLMQPPGNDPRGLLKEHWQLPSWEEVLSAQEVANRLKIPLSAVRPGGTLRHTITRHKISGVVFVVEPLPDRTDLAEHFPLAEPEKKSALHHALGRKIFSAAGMEPER